MRFRKKPVEIEAIRWTGANVQQIKEFVGVVDSGSDGFLTAEEADTDRPLVWDKVQAEYIPVNDNDWIIKGVKGEFYPCADDVFEATYEWVV